MPLRFYIASGLERAAEVQALAARLVSHGYVHTYDWTVHGSVQATPDRWSEVAIKEALGVTSADVVVVMLPGGKGTHTELGMAIGLTRPVIIVGDAASLGLDGVNRTCIFYHHPMVTCVATNDKVVEALAAIRRGLGR